jgi:hypothetical protein
MPTTRRGLSAAFVVVTAVAVCAAGRGWLRDTARAATDADEFRQSLRDEEERGVVLEAETRATRGRIAAKLALIDELVAGRVTLAHVAAEFRGLNVAYPNFFVNMRMLYPGLPDDELLCRNVIDYCAGALEHRPERTAVLARLEDEFAAQRRRETR